MSSLEINNLLYPFSDYIQCVTKLLSSKDILSLRQANKKLSSLKLSDNSDTCPVSADIFENTPEAIEKRAQVYSVYDKIFNVSVTGSLLQKIFSGEIQLPRTVRVLTLRGEFGECPDFELLTQITHLVINCHMKFIGLSDNITNLSLGKEYVNKIKNCRIVICPTGNLEEILFIGDQTKIKLLRISDSLSEQIRFGKSASDQTRTVYFDTDYKKNKTPEEISNIEDDIVSKYSPVGISYI